MICSHRHPNPGLKTLPLFIGALSVFCGGLVLAGWAFDLAPVKSLHPAWVSMKANTALGFILAGLSLLAASLPSFRLSVPLTRFFALLCALVGLLTLGEYAFSWDPGFDQWLFPEPRGTVGTSHPGRMAPDTAACFVLLSLGLALAGDAGKKMIQFWTTTIFGSLVMAVSLAALLAYFQKAIGPFGFWGLTMMAAHTATIFVFLGTGLVLLSWPAGISLWSLRGRTAMSFALWSLMVVGALIWGLQQQGHNILNESAVAARAAINKDLAFRRWGTLHGGVYVEPSEQTPPNPYLTVPNRDVVTTTGKVLTLMNPAYMLREMQQNFGDDYGTRSSITSLKPLNPANAPDAWQAKALSFFEQGGTELMEVEFLNGNPYMRLMQPFTVDQGCLKCHAHQGYKLGDIRGGVSTSVPLAPFLGRARKSQTTLALSFGAIWLFGITGLLFFYRRELKLDEENQHSAAALRASEERFRLAAETANDLVYEWDLQERVQWSGRIDEMLGYGEGEFPRTLNGWTAELHPQDCERVMTAIQAHLKEDVPYAVEYRIRKKDGAYQWWSARGTAVRRPDGTPYRWIGTVTDISKDKLAEEERQKLESQLRQAQKMEAIGTLAGGIAHDFNNILSIIFGYSELAMGEKDPEKCRQHLKELRKGAERAKELVSQILAFSRKTEQQKQPLQLSLIVKEALKLLRSSIPSTIEIRQNIASTGKVLADSTQIHQVIMNLCTNAYHAMRETGGTLGVSLEEIEIGPEDYVHANLSPGRYLRLTVSDTGCGIDPKIIEKIFEPYFTTKKLGEGTGMGLAVVHGIVKSHHGHITVYSEPGKGSSFHVYLPLTKEDAAVLPVEAGLEDLRGKGERILFIDDEESICKIAAAMLSMNGYQVAIFANGALALAEFEKEPARFDLVITDMTMPSMTGAELAQKILAMRPEIPVILCTGQSELINREKALAMGISDYLSKPILKEKLLVAARKALNSSSAASDQGKAGQIPTDPDA